MSRKCQRPTRLAEKLLAIRQRLGLSQTQMVRRLEFAGHYGRISEYELGKRQPSLLTLLAYASVANLPLEAIVDDNIEL
jgi:transcriptional regulator with XRE-family HTH domain